MKFIFNRPHIAKSTQAIFDWGFIEPACLHGEFVRASSKACKIFPIDKSLMKQIVFKREIV